GGTAVCWAVATNVAPTSRNAAATAPRNSFMRLEYQTMDQLTLTPSRVWKRMTPDQRLRASRAFWLDEQAADDQMEAVLIISQQKKFRPKTVLSLDADRQARHLASLGSVPAKIAARALVTYHLAEQRPMMAAFLDA